MQLAKTDHHREFHQAVGERIAARRRSRGLTQKVLADQIQCLSRTSLANIEKGRQQLLLIHAARIANVLDLSLDELAPFDLLPDQQSVESARESGAISSEATEWIKKTVAENKE